MKIIFLFISVVSIFLFLESVFRIWLPEKTYYQIQNESLSCYRPSKIIPYEYAPGCKDSVRMGDRNIDVAINTIGLRSPSVGDKSKKRILLLGDSFVFGFGVQQEEMIAHYLQKQIGGEEEVISAGFLGDSGPDTSLSYLLHTINLIQPDIVIVVLFPYNDLGDLKKTKWSVDESNLLTVHMPDRWVDSNGYLRRQDTPWKYSVWLLRDSHLFQFVVNRLEYLIGIWIQKISIKLGIVQEGQIRNESFERCLYEKRCDGEWGVVKEKATTVFSSLRSFSKEHEIPLLVVSIPLKSQIDGEKSMETVFHRWVSETSLPFLDLFHSLRAENLEATLYLPDGHFTAMGNKIAAEAMADWLSELQLLQSASR